MIAAGSATVSLEAVTPASAVVLANLLHLYMHDLSVTFGVDVGLDGRFTYANLPRYLDGSEDRVAFLIRRGERPAGFALVTRGSPASDDPEAFDVAEFFVLRRHRRSGVGAEAATLLWKRLPGAWVVRVAEANQAALTFWRRIVTRFTGGAFAEAEKTGAPHAWRVLTFDSPTPAGAGSEIG